MDLNDSFFVQVLVWARLLKLPMEFWYEDVFDRIAKSFGELLSIDPFMVVRSQLTYARICIGVSEDRDMP